MFFTTKGDYQRKGRQKNTERKIGNLIGCEGRKNGEGGKKADFYKQLKRLRDVGRVKPNHLPQIHNGPLALWRISRKKKKN